MISLYRKFRGTPKWPHLAILLFCLFVAAGCAHHSHSSGHSQSQVVDLTHPFDDTTLYWPTSKTFHLEHVYQGMTDGGYWYEANNIEAAEHGGTHMDAPVHFAKGAWTVDEIPVNRLIGPGIMVDLSAACLENRDYRFQREDFRQWEADHGRIPPGSLVLVRTGFEQFWPDAKQYLGATREEGVAALHFPGFSEDAARFLSEERRVAAVGLDTASLDYGQSKDFRAHRVFGAANVPGFENLMNLSRLPARGFRVIALPMKIGGGSGAPLRVVAEIP